MNQYRPYQSVVLAIVFVAATLLPGAVMAADAAKGRAELVALLDGILNSEFRRVSRVRAALHECELDEQAATVAPTEAEASRGEFEFSKAVFSETTPDIKAYLKTIAPPDSQRHAIAAMYRLALAAYFRGVRDGANGSLIWVDDDDKKKLCAYMVREAEDFIRLRAGR